MQQTQYNARRLRLKDIFSDAQFSGKEDIYVESCCCDSRQCQPGDLFVALVGSQHDGHDYVNEAIENGAAAILGERFVATTVPSCIVRDTRESLGRLCQKLAGSPADSMTMIGVTGTNGKTTTSLLIASVLEAAGQAVGVSSSLAYSDSRKTSPARLTTPAPPELAEWLSRMSANGCESSVIETSSHALAQHRTAGLQFDAAVLTNVRRDHLDYHSTVQNYRNAKRRLFQQLKPGGFAVVNADDPASRFILPSINHPTLTIALHSEAELTATVVERHKSEQTFLINAGSETAVVRTRMIGDHHIYNCLCASAVGLAMGIDLPTVVRGLEALEYIPGRLERLECGQPFGVYVDYAHTPDALAVSLKALRRVTEKRVICVYGAGGDRDQDKRPLMGRVVERGADVGVITSDNPRSEEPLQIIHDIMDGYDRPAKARVMPDRNRAITWALGEANPGDTVLIAGKGHEEYQIIGNRRLPFNDSDIARHWLYEVGAKTEPALGIYY